MMGATRAEGGELILFAIGLPDLAAVAVADLAAGGGGILLHVSCRFIPPLVAAVNGLDEREQVQVSAIRPYSMNACPSGVGCPSRRRTGAACRGNRSVPNHRVPANERARAAPGK